MFYGKRLLPTWIDKFSRETADEVWAAVPRSMDPKKGFCDVQYLQLVAVIDTIAWWIESIVVRSTDFETVAYMGCIFF